MKYVFSFIFGAAVGAGVTFLLLHKEIKKELDEIRENSSANGENGPESPVNGPNSNEMPFVVSEGGNDKNSTDGNSAAQRGVSVAAVTVNQPVAVQEKTHIRYENLIRDNYGGEVQNPSENAVNLQKREEESAGVGTAAEISQEIFDDVNGNHWTPIDNEEFDNNPGFSKDRLVFYEGDRVLCTDNGNVIENGYLLIGDNWEDEVGHYANRTAYIRNNKTAVDYEIYVEAGSYRDEWGTEGAPLVED